MNIRTVKTFIIIFSLATLPAVAHVKWFASNTNEGSAITSFSQLNHPSFWFLLFLSIATIGLFVYLDRRLEHWSPYLRFNEHLSSFKDRANVILRIFTGAALLLTWQSDTLVAPELKVSDGVGWFEFAVTLLLLTRTTTWLAGLGMLCLYVYGISEFGLFHMLDYLVFAAIGYFFLVSAPAIQSKQKLLYASRIPALYIGLGFSLCWAAFEKIVFPNWGLDVLAQNPQLTFGLNPEFFLLACAFVELSLGYLLIIGLLQRPLALTISIVFFLTSMVFGKIEVIGHTILHGALLVFIVAGPGTYFSPPIKFHRSLTLRALFAAVNFVVVIAVLGFAYLKMSARY